MTFETEFHFVLPRGYVDQDGTVHREGVMRLANAADEILPLRDPKVQQNPGYLTIILLTRVITKLGTLPMITTKTIEGLFTLDLAYLQDFYDRSIPWKCRNIAASAPHCGQEVDVPVNFMEAIG